MSFLLICLFVCQYVNLILIRKKFMIFPFAISDASKTVWFRFGIHLNPNSDLRDKYLLHILNRFTLKIMNIFCF